MLCACFHATSCETFSDQKMDMESLMCASCNSAIVYIQSTYTKEREAHCTSVGLEELKLDLYHAVFRCQTRVTGFTVQHVSKLAINSCHCFSLFTSHRGEKLVAIA